MRCTVSVAAENTAFSAAGGSGNVRITINRECQWNASAEAAWITLASREGQGAGSVSFTVGSNADPASRNTSILVNDQRLPIAQQGRPCTFTLSSKREVVNASGGQRTIQVRASSSQCTWTASTNEPWITIGSGTPGRGDGDVSFSIAPGNGPPRIGTLTIAGETVQVEQGTGCTVAIPNGTVTIPASGGDREIAVTAGPGCAWTAESSTPWIAILSGRTGSGSGAVVFRVPATNEPERTGTLTVAGRTVTVVQAPGCSYSVSPASQQISGPGGPAAASVSTPSGCAWNAASGVTWITMTTTSGNGPGSATFTVAPNLSPARSATLTIAGQSHTVNQASVCTWSLAPTSVEMPAAGGFGIALVFVAGGQCSWTATSTVDWVRVTSISSGLGGGNVQFVVSPNTGPARTGVVLIGGENYRIAQQASR